MQVTTIGLDLAKNLFQVHAVDDGGQVVLRRRLARAEVVPFFATLAPCRIGAEACGTAHYRARQLIALGHEVRLMPAAYVKPYVKRGKNDAADAEAICEAVTRPTMRFVPVKSADAQSVLMLHRTRHLLVCTHCPGERYAGAERMYAISLRCWMAGLVSFPIWRARRCS